MTTLLTKDVQLKHVAKSRPNSLILRIPAMIRDIMEFERDEILRMEVCLDDNNQKCIKISKLD